VNHQKETATPAASIGRGAGLGCGGLVLLAALSVPGLVQAQSAAPAPSSDDTLTWKGITLYGIVDVGIQNQSHGAPISDYFVGGSAEVVQKNSNHAVTGVVPSSLSNSRVDCKESSRSSEIGRECSNWRPFFNPQSGQIAGRLEIPGAEQRPVLGESEHQRGLKRFGPDLHPVLCGGEFQDLRDHHIRPSKHGTCRRHRQVRP